MAGPQLKAQRCPVCSAPLEALAPAATSITCRYCGNVIAVEHRKPTAAETRAGFQQGRPPTLYVHTGGGGGKAVGCFVAGMIFFTVVLPLGAAFGGGCVRMVKNSVKPFPATCSVNEELHLSGKDWKDKGPAINAGTNCKIWVEGGKFGGDAFFVGKGSNVELHLENVEVVVTGTAIVADHNMKLFAKNSKIEGGQFAMKAEGNVELELEGGTFTGGKAALSLGSNPKVEAAGTAFVSKENGIVVSSNAKIDLKNKARIDAGKTGVVSESSLEFSQEDGILKAKTIGIKTTSNGKLNLSGVDLSTAANAIVADSSARITLTNTKLLASEIGVQTGSSSTIEVEGGTLVGKTAAVRVDSSVKVRFKGTTVQSDGVVVDARSGNSEVTAEGAKMTGGEAVVLAKTNTKLRLTKKSEARARDGLLAESNTEVACEDSTIEASTGIAIRVETNGNVKLTSGCKVTGKRRGLEGGTNLTLSVSQASIASDGIGVKGGSNGRLTFNRANIRGTEAALDFSGRVMSFDESDSQFIGARKTPGR